jgi:hypothetical protein
MRRRFQVGVVSAAIVGLVAIHGGAARADAPTISGFTSYVRCSPDGVRGSAPTRVCQQGDLIWAVARYGGRPVEYRVCVELGESPAYCSFPQLTAPGKSSITKIHSKDFVGLATISWHTSTAEIWSDSVRFVKDPVVPPFGTSPLIVSGTHRLFGLIVRHVPAGLRVRAWRTCERGCPLPLRLVGRKGETRRYRIVASKRKSTFSLGDQLLVAVDAPWLPKGSRLWSRLYRGVLVRDRGGGPNDTAIRRVGSPLCSPPGQLFGFAKKCSKVRNPEAPLDAP